MKLIVTKLYNMLLILSFQTLMQKFFVENVTNPSYYFNIQLWTKKNCTLFGSFFAMVISLWVFETQMKNWYYWREEILNFIMVCFFCSYSHLFERYGCVSEIGTLCSQSRLIHFITSFSKNFLFVQSLSD